MNSSAGVGIGVGVGGGLGAGGAGVVGPGVGVGAGGPSPATVPTSSAPGADMKRAYEALGIACPTSVAGLGGFSRAPLRLAGPRAPLAETGPAPAPPAAPPSQMLFAQQQQDMQQQHQLVTQLSHSVSTLAYIARFRYVSP